MDYCEAAGWVARSLDCATGSGAVTFRPRDARVTFRPPGGAGEVVMDYGQLIAEGERLRSENQGAQAGQPQRGQHYSFDYRDANGRR